MTCDSDSHQQQQCVNNDDFSSDYDETVPDDLSEFDSWSDDEIPVSICLKTNTNLSLMLLPVFFFFSLF